MNRPGGGRGPAGKISARTERHRRKKNKKDRYLRRTAIFLPSFFFLKHNKCPLAAGTTARPASRAVVAASPSPRGRFIFTVFRVTSHWLQECSDGAL